MDIEPVLIVADNGRALRLEPVIDPFSGQKIPGLYQARFIHATEHAEYKVSFVKACRPIAPAPSESIHRKSHQEGQALQASSGGPALPSGDSHQSKDA